jgi:hypothetical protein
VVGGAAYYAGKRGAENQAMQTDQDARLAALEQQQYQQQQQPQYAAPPPPAAPAPSSGGISDQGIEELKKLAELKEQGILTDAEFEVQKAKILQGG